MGGFRARDDDRERYVEVIQTAYVDGQLGAEDRELRVSRALTAETLDELEALTRDLQNQPARTVVQTPAPRVVEPEPVAMAEPVPWPVPVKDHAPLRFLGYAVAAVVVLVMLLMIAAPRQELEGLNAEPDFSDVDLGEDRYVAPDPTFRVSPGDIREMKRAYEAEFGTSRAHGLVVRPRQVVVVVPPGGTRQGHERWSWDGAWSKIGSTPVDGAGPLVDLDAVDAGRLVDNVRTATRALRVEDARFSRAVLTRDGEDAVIEIVVGNTFNEFGSLITTPGGDIVRREPFER